MFRNASRAAMSAMVVLCCSNAIGVAQTGKAYTTADYAQAEKFMDYNVKPLVYHSVEHPAWLPDGRFWYRDAGPDGVTYMLVDPAKGTKAPAFDQAKIAAALNAAVGSGQLSLSSPLDPNHLSIDDLALEDGDRTVILTIGQKRVRCGQSGAGGCKSAGEVLPKAYNLSPDGKKAVFIRDSNLWTRDIASGRETQLTTDGVPDFGYATDNASATPPTTRGGLTATNPFWIGRRIRRRLQRFRWISARSRGCTW